MRISKMRKVIPLIVLILILLAGMSARAEVDTITIRVGYTQDYGTIKSPMVVGDEGYGYEYLNTIFSYIEGDYELEFVCCEWLEVGDMLASGEIDIFGPITYTETSAAAYVFTEDDFGDNFIFLSTLNENASYYMNYQNLDGSVIAVQENNPNESLLHAFLEENGLEAEIVYFTNNDYEEVMLNSDYDFCLCSSLQYFQYLTPIVNLGVVDAYYVTMPENAELIALMDEAMESVHESEYMYQEKLYLEYYDYSILSDSYITQEEYALLQEKDIYYVGIEDIYGPIEYKDENGDFQGVAVDVMDMIASIAGIEYVFVEVTDETTFEELEALDFAILSYDGDWHESAIESVAFCEMPYILVERPMAEEENITNIGILVHYGFTEKEEGYLYGREIVEYDDLQALQEAYNKGEIDSMVMTVSNMNLIRNEFNATDYVVTTLDFTLNLCLTFQEGASEELIDVFNKVIEQLDSKEVEASVLRNSTGEDTEVDLEAIIRRYPYAFPTIIIVVALMIIGEIILAGKKRRRELSNLLNYDKLTGLLSAHKFEEDTRNIMQNDSADVYSIVTIDIDNFKYINDIYGYETGNEVIKKVADCITVITPQAVLVARNSSDVFMVLLKREINKSHKLKFDVEDRKKLLEALLPYIGESYKLSFSIGIFDICDQTLDINFMIDCANIARVQGKRFAHTTINIFDSDMDRKRMISTKLIANMVQGINQREFIVYYQPKICLESQKVAGAEALVRWSHDGRLIPPNDFIPLFEKNGFIQRLDFYVVEEVCQFIKEHQEMPRISVNLSGVTITKVGVAQEILKIVDRYQVSHRQLEFEITETAFVDEFEQVANELNVLRNQGFIISMDDFGVGISSLSRLKNIPIDVLKVDREFIWDSIGNDKGKEIIKNIINMANGLELETVAEGIETKEQEYMLLELGCNIGQGYHYARPLPEDEFISWMERN